jgi:protein SCO1/2
MIIFLRAITRIILFFSLAWVLVACDSKPTFKNVDITGSKAFGTNFGLIDVDGKLRTLADYQGKAVVMFFGYTHCPDVCPTTLIEMQEAMRLLGPQAAKCK